MLLHTCCYGIVLVGSDRLTEASDILEWAWLITPDEINVIAARRRDELRAIIDKSGVSGVRSVV
jgi:aspartokinase-like uncharacterized kinase